MSESHEAVLERSPADQHGRFHISRRRWLAAVGAAALVLAIIGLVILARHWPFSQRAVIDALQDDLHGTVAFRSFHKTFFPHPGCVAEGATLVREGFPSGSPPFATGDKLIVRAHYWDLLLRPGYLAHIEVAGLQVHVPPIGTMPPAAPSQYPSTMRVGEVIANNSVLEIARKAGAALRFEIHALRLDSVSRKDGFGYDVAFLNATPPGEIESRGHFGPYNSDDPGQTPVSGTYKFEHAYLGVFGGINGVLTSHDHFQGTLAQIEMFGTVNIPDFQVQRAARSLPVDTRFHSFVNGLDGDVRLEHVESVIVKTKVLSRGGIEEHPNSHGKVTDLDLNVSNGRIQDVLRMFIKEPRSPIVGVISFRAQAKIPPEGRPFEQKVQLVGDFGIDDGQFTKTKTQKEVETLSERAQGKNTNDKEKEEEDDADAARVVSGLKGHVELKNGVATLTDISFTVPGATAYVHGTFNLLSEKLDFHGVLRTDANFSKVGGGGIKSFFLKPFDAIFKKKPKGAEIPIKMTGTYSHPEPGLEISGGKKSENKEK